MKKNTWLPLTTFSLMLASGSIILTACGDQSSQNSSQEKAKPAVEVYTVKSQPVDIITVLPARTSSYRIAEIRPQVSGVILKREFVEGSQVKAGQSLYLIDPAPYEATLNSAKANLNSAKASAEVNRLTVNRYKSLLNNRSISQQDYDQAVATLEQAVASVGIAEAELETAKINLAYTRVYSPIDGHIGKSSVTEGALVTASQTTLLATVQQLDPIYVDMTQSSSQYMNMRSNTQLERKEDVADVTLYLENGTKYPSPGKIQFSDVTVDENTGSISLRAIFSNPDQILLPGMFVRAEVYEGTLKDGILVPQKAVSRDVKGNASVMLVNKDGKVETRSISVTKAIGSNWLVSDGLALGEQVIINGLQKVANGQAVTIVPSETKSN